MTNVLHFPTDAATRLVLRQRANRSAQPAERTEEPAPAENPEACLEAETVIEVQGYRDAAGRTEFVATDESAVVFVRWWAADSEREWVIEWLQEAVEERQRRSSRRQRSRPKPS